MPGAVDEHLSIPRTGDHIPCGPVHRLSRHPRPHRVDACALRLPQHSKRIPEPGRGITDNEHPAGVGSIASQPAPEVDDDSIAGFDHTVGGLVVRRRPVWAGCNDGKPGSLMPGFERELLDGPSHLTLGAPGDLHLRDLGDNSIRCRASSPEGSKLFFVFDDSQLGHQWLCLDEPRRGEAVLERQHKGGPGLVADSDRGGSLADEFGDDRDRVLRLLPGTGLDRRLNPRCLQGWHDQNRLGSAGQDEGGDALVLHRPVADEIREIRADRYDEGVDSALAHLATGCRDALRIHLVSASDSRAW